MEKRLPVLKHLFQLTLHSGALHIHGDFFVRKLILITSLTLHYYLRKGQFNHMKKLLLLAGSVSLLTGNIFAQCTPAIPSNAVVVNSTTTINGGFDPIWVCSGDTLHSDGGFHNTFLEPGAVMTTSVASIPIYVKETASFFMNGGIHVIFYVSASDLNISGGIPEQFACGSLNFNYSNAPTNGCALALLAAFQSSDSSICAGDCIDFTSLSFDASSWQWSFPGASLAVSTLENPQSICYDSPGIFDVILIVSNSSGSDTLTLNDFITVNTPTTPAVSQSNDTIFSTQGYDSYQWYYDNSPIPGATDYYYVITQGGDYTVVVIDSNGCSASQVIKTIPTGFSQLSQSTFRAFPNPATTSIFMISEPEATLEFIDLQGRIFYATTNTSTGQTEIDISDFPSIFLVRNDKGQLIKVTRYR
jgi:PKD repeat protein